METLLKVLIDTPYKDIVVSIMITAFACNYFLLRPKREVISRQDKDIDRKNKEIEDLRGQVNELKQEVAGTNNRVENNTNDGIEKPFSSVDPMSTSSFVFQNRQDVWEFWRQYTEVGECSLLLATPKYLWCGPISQKPMAHKYDSLIEIKGGYYTTNLLSNLPDVKRLGNQKDNPNETHYLAPQANVCSVSDTNCSLKLRTYLHSKIKIDLRISSTEGLINDGNLILIGGPSANMVVKFMVDLLYKEHGMNFKYKFRLYKHPQSESCNLVEEATATENFGIVRTGPENNFVVKYSEDDGSSEAGKDGAIIIKSFNPIDPDKTMLIIAGIDEYGTAAAVDFLKTPSLKLKDLNKLYNSNEGDGAVQCVIETKFHNLKWSPARVLGLTVLTKSFHTPIPHG